MEETEKLICDTIRLDDFEGGRQATRHLLKRGHRKLAFLGLHSLEMNQDEPSG